jgi:hypothetical protein
VGDTSMMFAQTAKQHAYSIDFEDAIAQALARGGYFCTIQDLVDATAAYRDTSVAYWGGTYQLAFDNVPAAVLVIRFDGTIWLSGYQAKGWNYAAARLAFPVGGTAFDLHFAEPDQDSPLDGITISGTVAAPGRTRAVSSRSATAAALGPGGALPAGLYAVRFNDRPGTATLTISADGALAVDGQPIASPVIDAGLVAWSGAASSAVLICSLDPLTRHPVLTGRWWTDTEPLLGNCMATRPPGRPSHTTVTVPWFRRLQGLWRGRFRERCMSYRSGLVHVVAVSLRRGRRGGVKPASAGCDQLTS